MKDFLILATITIIGGALIPSTKALAILAVITNVVLWIAGRLGARGLQLVQEVPNENPYRKPDGTCMTTPSEVRAEFQRRYEHHKPDGGCYTSMRELRERDARLYGRHSNTTRRR